MKKLLVFFYSKTIWQTLWTNNNISFAVLYWTRSLS